MQNTKLPKQHHDKKTATVKVYQNTKIDKQRHITDKNKFTITGVQPHRNR